MPLPKRCSVGGTYAGRITHLTGTMKKLTYKRMNLVDSGRTRGVCDDRGLTVDDLSEQIERERAELNGVREQLRSHVGTCEPCTRYYESSAGKRESR